MKRNSTIRPMVSGSVFETVTYLATLIVVLAIAVHQFQNQAFFSGAGLFAAAFVLFGLLLALLKKKQRRANEAVQQHQTTSTQKLTTLFEYSPMATVLVDYQNGQLLEANDAACQLFGYAAENVVNHTYWDLFDQVGQGGGDVWLELKTHGRFGPVNKRMRHDSGDVLDVVLYGSLFHDALEQPFVWSMVQDLTEQKRLEQLKNNFISTVSHELQTPLTAISGALGLLSGGSAGALTGHSRELIEIAHNNSKRLADMINDLLDLDQLATGRMELIVEPITAVGVFETAIQQHQSYADKQRVSFGVGEVSSASMLADFSRLVQVLSILISNAIRFSPANGQVQLSAEPHGDFMRITIRDDGEGVSSAIEPYVFNPFQHATQGTPKAASRSGQSLAIGQEIVQNMGGNICHESEPGLGTRFWIDIPLVESPLRDEDRLRVLIVEDAPNVARYIRDILTDHGFSSDIALSGQQARQLIGKHLYDVITLDLRLPDIEGVDLFDELRRRATLQHVPVLIISAHVEHGRLQLRGGIEALDWLPKPFEPESLIARLQSLLQESGKLTGRRGQMRLLHVEDNQDICDIVALHLGDKMLYSRAGSLAEAKASLRSRDFDAVLLDIGLPDGDGWALLTEEKLASGQIPVVVFSAMKTSEANQKKVAASFTKTTISEAQLIESIRTLTARHLH